MSEDIAKEIVDITDEVKALLLAKHHDYGMKNLDRFGSFGILVRVCDKVQRLENLMKNGNKAEVKEALEDTWMDIAGYSIQGVRYCRKESK